MKNLKDFLKELNEVLNVNEIEGFISAENLNEVEISEEGQEKIKGALENLMTVDGAKNNADLKKYFKEQLYPSITGEVLGNTDTELGKLVKQIFPDDYDKFKEMEMTKDKVKWLVNNIPNALKSDDKSKEKIQTLQSELEKVNSELAQTNEQKEKEIESLKSEFYNTQIKGEFNRYLLSKEWAEPYSKDGVKKALINEVYNEVNGEAVLRYEDDGKIGVYQKDNPELKYTRKGKPVEFNDLVDPKVDDYLKKSGEKPTEKPKLDLGSNRDKPIEKPNFFSQRMNN